jgi:sugar (pentulose or hexulose) kinase
LVFKGISRQICRHPDGLVYCHKLPGGRWLPGAAGNTGGEWIASLFPEADVRALDAAAKAHLPSDCLAYPLVRHGERFPFLAEAARGFFATEPPDDAQRYAACLQGVALVERLGYDVLDQVTAGSGGQVFSTGGGSQSDVWMQCRADVSGRVMHRPACGQSAFGTAVLAAAGTHYANLDEAIRRMVRIEKSFPPNPQHAACYDRLYDRYLAELRKRGYL